MDIRGRLHINGIYRLMNGAVLACIGLFALGGILGVSHVSRQNILVLSAVLLVLTLINFLSWKGKLLCLLSCAALLGVSAAVVGLETEGEFLLGYLRWCMGYAGERAEWIKGYQLLQTAAIAAGAYFLEMLLEKLGFLKPLLALLGLVFLAVCLFLQRPAAHMGVVFIFFYLVETCLEFSLRHWERVQGGSAPGSERSAQGGSAPGSGRSAQGGGMPGSGTGARRENSSARGVRAQMVWLSPFLIAFLVLTALMPAPEEPLPWNGVKNMYQQLVEALRSVSWSLFPGGNDTFEASLSGFSEEGSLGGGVRRNDREVMKLSGCRPYTAGIYLTGNILDSFDGRQWRKRDDAGEEERFLDAWETLRAAELLDGGHREDYLKETELWVEYEYFRSEYVFAPLKTFELGEEGAELQYSFNGGDMVSARELNKGSGYRLRFYQLNIGEELFDELAEEAGRLLFATQEVSKGMPAEEFLPEGTLPEEQPSEGTLPGELSPEELLPEGTSAEEFLGELQAHRAHIYETYLDEVTLSEETAAYLEEITEGRETPMEKLRGIEEELRSFTYTGNPGGLPETVTDAGTFLDYFLLESRQGYCTYFATAFVLLARAQGIPARYVQGFCVPVERNGETTVLSSMAHSWPEAYLDGLGWIPFEPTPGYEGLRYTPWKVESREGLSGEGDGKLTGGSGESLDGEEEEEAAKRAAEEAAREEAAREEAERLERQKELERRRELERALRMLVWGISALLAVGMLVLAGDILYVGYRYGRMVPEERLKTEIRRNLKILSWLGIRQREEETLQELAERALAMPVLAMSVPAAPDMAPGVPPLHFIEIYEMLLYSGKAVCPELLESVRKEREALHELLKRRKRIFFAFYLIVEKTIL